MVYDHWPAWTHGTCNGAAWPYMCTPFCPVPVVCTVRPQLYDPEKVYDKYTIYG